MHSCCWQFVLSCWSKAWKISIFARLLDAERAYYILSDLMASKLYGNLWTTHLDSLLLSTEAIQIDFLNAWSQLGKKTYLQHLTRIDAQAISTFNVMNIGATGLEPATS